MSGLISLNILSGVLSGVSPVNLKWSGKLSEGSSRKSERSVSVTLASVKKVQKWTKHFIAVGAKNTSF